MLLPAILLAATLTSGDTTSKPAPAPPKTIPELEARIQKVLDSTHTPGVGLVIVRHDSILYAGGIGLARVSPKTPATAATLFRIGSTSKSFVALTALALQEEGKLSLQDPLKQRMPNFYFANQWEGTDPVRIVNLLEHTSGFDDNSLMSYANNDPTPLTLAQGLALDSATRVSRWRPGTIFSYCNTGPAIVARIAEQIEGKPWEQIVQERWFTPIGMTTATYLRPDTTKVPVATLYRDNGYTPVPYWYVFIRPAGSINASAHDMGNYVRFFLGRGTIDGKRLLPPAAIERMERSETWIGARAGLTVGYGLNMYRIADTTGWVWTQHNGGVEGGLSDLSYVPAAGIGYAFQINTGNGDALNQIQGLVRAYLTQGLTPAAPVARTPLAADLAPKFTGWYRTVSPRQQHLYFLERLVEVEHVTFTDSGARIKPLLSAAFTLVPAGERLFRRAAVPVATRAFISDPADGRPEGMETFNSATKRVSGFDAVGSALLAACWLAGVVLSLLVPVFGGARFIARRAMEWPTPRAAAGTVWRVALLSGGLITLNLLLASIGAGDVRVIGNASFLSVGAWAAGLLFAISALAAAFVAFRRHATATGWQRMSLAVARGIVVLNVIAAAYLAYWGYIGWRTWA